MWKRLDEDVLRPGDIALTTSGALVSRKIRIATGGDVSHAMLYVTHCSVVHAVSEGVHAENSQRIFFEEDCTVRVMRLKGDLPPDVARLICDHVRRRVGSEYSVREAIRAGIGGARDFSAKQFCSRLVAQAFDEHGFRLVADPNYCTPADLGRSDALHVVEGATRPVPDEEYEFWQGQVDGSPDLTLRATNHVLSAVRKADPSVQSWGDLGRFLIGRPEHDGMVDDLLHESGYLDIWRHDVEGLEWRYDLALMERMGDQAGVGAYCAATMKLEPKDDNRFTKSLAGLRLDHSVHQRRSFATLIRLYERLVDLNAQRMDTAAEWTRRRGAGQVGPPP